MNEQEFSESGDPIFRYDDVTAKNFVPATGDNDNIIAISDHIEKYIGKVDFVFHEIVSDIVHIDVHWVKPTLEFPFNIFITSGMSDKPMNAPPEANDHRYAELCILLPSDWKISDNSYFQEIHEVFKDEKNYWPIRWLKIIARFPHEYGSWVGNGHTIPNGEDALPYADNTKFGCMIILPSLSLPKDFFKLKVNEEKTIEFYCLYPLYKEEMLFKLKKGRNALIDNFEKYHVDDIVNIKRVNACSKKGLFGLW